MLINLTTQERVWDHDFLPLFPDVSFPTPLTDSALAPFGYATLTYPPPPTPTANQLVADTGTQAPIDGVWTVTYAVTAMTADQIAQAAVQAQQQVVAAVQAFMDQTAQSRNYDSLLSLCTYATSSNPTFQKEGQAGVVWRDAVWTFCYALLAQVDAGSAPSPTVAGILAQLPAIGW